LRKIRKEEKADKPIIPEIDDDEVFERQWEAQQRNHDEIAKKAEQIVRDINDLSFPNVPKDVREKIIQQLNE
jgi:hypothetical protein